MKHKLVNQLLTACSVAARQRHMPDVADVIKQVAVLVNSVYTLDDEQVLASIKKVVSKFEAELVAGGTVTAQDLVMETAEPVAAVEDEVVPLEDVDEPDDLFGFDEFDETGNG